ncbi:MAG: alpha-(1-_3)-arabinofuranosyltransferase family protein [Acidimicrobiia bacterium]
MSRTPAPAIGRGASPAATSRRQRVLGYALLAALSYVPLLLSASGRAVTDTKQYLYLDPGRLLSRAPYLWSPNVHQGSLTHQDIGYLFPAGPFYWLFDQLGVPVWAAQRLWLGSIIFAAGLGVLYLLRTLKISGPGAVVAALVYMFSPYFLQYASRISIILVAWSAAPWLIALIARALRDGGWRYPAAFAIVVQLAGSVNPPSLFFVGLAPLLWVAHAIWVSGEVSARQALRTCARIALLTVLASAWWVAGLIVQGAYGLDVLRYSESIEAVAVAGHSGEVLRGLGYWLFYGGDRLGPWTEASVDYSRRWLVVTGYTVPVLAMLSAAFVRWKHRAYFVALIVVGVAIAVGTHPYDDPSPFGAVVKKFGEGSTVGLGLRSVGRAVPLLVLGVAVLLGVGANVLSERLAQRHRPRMAFAVCAVLAVLAAVNLPLFWTGDVYGANVQRRDEIPAYWTDAINALDGEGHDTRILELPGMDAAVYRWGDTNVPITPGLTDRPYVARELIPYGSAASANLLEAFDRRIQRGLLDPDSVAPIAALMSVGDVVLRSDVQVDQYDLARPREAWLVFRPTPDGLVAPERFGNKLAPPLELDQLDARELAVPDAVPSPPPVAVFGVERTRPIVRAESGSRLLLVSGDGDGLVDLAQAGLLVDSSALRYSASFSHDRRLLVRALHADSVLIVTDTNRSRAQHWSEHDDLGYTQRPNERQIVEDDQDQRLDVFPDAGQDAFTVMEQRGAKVSASAYGTATRFVPSDRPARALDSDLGTAWRVGAYGPVQGEWISIRPGEAITTDHVNLVQPLTGRRDRYLTRVELRFGDGNGRSVGQPVTVDLGEVSRTVDGQDVSFEPRRFAQLEVIVLADNVGDRDRYQHDSAVGFAEIRLADESSAEHAVVDEVVWMPTDLVGTAAARMLSNPLLYEMTRLRSVLSPPNVTEEEGRLARSFLVPTARDFGVAGTARLSPAAPDDVLDRVLGIADADSGGVTVRASGHLRTTALARGSSAIDGDAATAWITDADVSPVGEWIDLELPTPVTFDELALELVADGRHSVPTRLRLEAGGETRTVDVPAIKDGDNVGSTVEARATFPALTGDRVRVAIEEVRAVETIDYDSGLETALPVAVAELGFPGVQRASLPGAVPTACRSDLLEIDGAPVAVRLVGAIEAGSAHQTFQIERCNPTGGAPSGLRLKQGKHELRAASGAETGIDVDGLVLASAGGGDALDGRGALIDVVAAKREPSPQVDVLHNGRTRIEARVRGADNPFWLVLGQSLNRGWHAEVNGRDLGEPVLVDGMANGWRIDPARRNLEINFTWAPQRTVWVGIVISGLTLLGCAVLALRGRSRAPTVDADAAPTAASLLVAAGTTPSRSRVVATTVMVAVLSGLLVEPWVGALAGAAALAVLLVPRTRWLLAIGAPAALAATGLYVFVQQSRYGYPPGLDWPSRFDAVHVVGMIAVVLLLTDVIVEAVRSRGRGLDTP